MEVRFKHATCRIDFLESADEGKYVYLSEMYVPPEHRKKGLATGLLRKIINLAKRNDCKRIVLHCLFEHFLSSFSEQKQCGPPIFRADIAT